MKPMQGEYKPSDAVEVPILYPCQEGEQDGYANFGDNELPVRAITPDDMDPKTKNGRKFVALVGNKPMRFARAILELKRGFRRRAPKLLREWFEELYDKIFPEPDQSDDEILKNLRIIEQLAAGHMSLTGLLPWLLSEAIQDVRLVLWWSGRMRRFLPALFCPTAAAAALTVATLGFVGKLIMICPRCGRLFVARRSDQECCSPKCREARRQARHRARSASRSSTGGARRS